MIEAENYTKELFELLKVSYKNAVEHDLDMFVVNKHQYVREYAKYLIEHLTFKFKKIN